jgi:RNA polymerase sigma-70 factor, ECF subfamily
VNAVLTQTPPLDADSRPATGGPAGDAILDRLLSGDEAAFSDFVAAHHGSLLRLARTFVANQAAAEEVVQETWLGVVKGLQSFERRSSLKTWIFRILVNRARTRGGRDGRTVNFSALENEGGTDSLAERFSAAGRWIRPPALWREQNPEDLVLRRETAECVEGAIASLPANQRAVISLRDVDGVDAVEVCRLLDISEANQRVLLHRARTKVRSILEQHLART